MLVIDNPAATLHLAVLIIPFFFFFPLSLLDFVCVSRATIWNSSPNDFIGSILCYITLRDIAAGGIYRVY